MGQLRNKVGFETIYVQKRMRKKRIQENCWAFSVGRIYEYIERQNYLQFNNKILQNPVNSHTQPNTKALTSILSLVSSPALSSSTNAECGTRLALPSVFES
jgi:hypothetical protein